MRRINRRDHRIAPEPDSKPLRARETVTADEVIAHFEAKRQWGRPGAKIGTLRVAVRNIRIAIEEICSGVPAKWGGSHDATRR